MAIFLPFGRNIRGFIEASMFPFQKIDNYFFLVSSYYTLPYLPVSLWNQGHCHFEDKEQFLCLLLLDYGSPR